MNIMTLGDSELKVMNIIWDNTPNQIEAKTVCSIATSKYGWNKNTTYTLIKRCIEKGALLREEPNFICKALISKTEVQQEEVKKLTDKVFDGSSELLFSSLLSNKGLSADKIEVLKNLIDKMR